MLVTRHKRFTGEIQSVDLDRLEHSSAFFVDWVSMHQTHEEDLPIVNDGTVIGTDQDGELVWKTTRHAPLEGSYDTSLRVRCDGHTVAFSGNVSRFCRTDNLFGYSFKQCLTRINAVLGLQGLPPFTPGKFFRRTVKTKQGIELVYAISTLVQELLNRALKRKGQEIKRRLLVDGVTGLVIPHERLAPGVEADDGSLQPGEGQGIWNWWEWCQPGDVIFVDEVQRWFRPRGLGVKVPPEIKHLETHRHLGVDFVFVTQNPMLLDQNIRRLVYRHQHIRRLWGMQRAMIYEWDGCAENVKSTKAATMRQWGYPRSAYALYQSSELHTKPKVRVPIWAFLPIVAAIGAVFLAPTVFSTMQSAMTGKGLIPQQAQAKPATPPAMPPAPSTPLPPVPAPMPAPGLALASPASDAPKPSGCILTPGGVCKCMDTEGGRLDMDVDICRDLATPGRKVVDQPAIAELPLARVVTPEEMDLYQFVGRSRSKIQSSTRGSNSPG